MKLFLDYLPIIFFFIAYKIWNIYVATAVAIAVLIIQVVYTLIRHKKVETTQWINLVILVVFGGATLIFHKAIFIKWKVSVVYWLFGLVLLGMQWIRKKSLLQNLVGKHLAVPDSVWRNLTIAWSIFFLMMGCINTYVIYHYTTEQWVNFKLFGTFSLVLIFCVAQAFYLNKYIDQNEEKNNDSKQ